MPNPFSLPDWVPPWAQLLLVIGGLLIILCFAVMPFSVFGVKSRLELIEARLDEIQGEIRSLILRLPEPGARLPEAPDDEPRLAPRAHPPVPPTAWTPDSGPRRPIGSGAQPAPRQERPSRMEPRLDRYR